MTLSLDQDQQAARDWFESLRDRICAEFEAIEREAGSDAHFEYLGWDRTEPDGTPGGGGVRGVMKGKIFEKVGVNVSTVGGALNPDFAQTIHGAGEDPACARSPYEHPLPQHQQAVVWRRRGFEPAYRL
jgi:coproporphyrinogen III oxidase